VIEYRDVWKSFDAPVLAGVNLTVRSGELLSLLGPSGTGKSVLLKTTIGLIVPDRGDVFLDGQSVYFGGPGALEAVRRKVGYVFQYAALFDSLTVYENVSQGLSDEELKALPRREVLARVCHALEDVNLDPQAVLHKLPAELSGGMRKRVGLARAIVGQPEILLYDEPVTGLDPVNTAAVERLVTEIRDKLGVTSMFVTHNVEGALAISDRVALLDHGLLRFVGSPDEFRRSADELVRAFGDRAVAMATATRMMEE
jgi:phospholipid/cholesterol/gamma-HCH transport system ATP-binding protein